jgi:hypothetical protein
VVLFNVPALPVGCHRPPGVLPAAVRAPLIRRYGGPPGTAIAFMTCGWMPAPPARAVSDQLIAALTCSFALPTEEAAGFPVVVLIQRKGYMPHDF